MGMSFRSGVPARQPRAHGRRLVLVLVAALGLTAATAPVAASSPALSAGTGTAPVLQVTATGSDTCALVTAGTVECWGFDFPLDPDGLPVPYPSSPTYSSMSPGGGDDICAVPTAGGITCLTSSGYSGGSGPPTSGTYISVVTGYGGDACALSSAGALDCWGLSPITEPGPFTAIGDGAGDTCGITTAGTIDCYFYGGAVAPTNPYGPPPAGTFTALAMGFDFACALGTDQAITCWGDNDYGQADAPAGTFTQVSAGSYGACALTTRGAVTCWGDNDHGELQEPSGTFTSVSVGYDHSCGIRTDGLVYCWGDDEYYQLGAAPVLTPQLDGITWQDDPYVASFGASDGTQDGVPTGIFAISGKVPPGLTFGSLTGLLTGKLATPGSFRFTVSVANIIGAPPPVTEDVIVRGWFLGWKDPRSRATVSPRARRLTVTFGFGLYSGQPMASRYAHGLQLEVTLSARTDGTNPVATGSCGYSSKHRLYACTLRLPKNLKTGRGHPYYLTALQQDGPASYQGYQPVPVPPKGTANTETIYFG